MTQIDIRQQSLTATAQQRFEYVERKGIGHPDTICDSIMESISVALCRAYQEVAGRVLHHNIDKGLLVAGRSQPACGGGVVTEPMQLIVGDRATFEYEGQAIDVPQIAEATARQWMREHLRFVDPQQHLIVRNELKPGSPELTGIFRRPEPVANDTSATVGYAPLSETERLVLETESFLNSAAIKAEFPQSGEDVKVMAVRRDRIVGLTVAVAFVDRFVSDPSDYFARKEELRERLASHLLSKLEQLDGIEVAMNTLDDPKSGESGIYLTVLGTSADGADGGQVGRGNRVNGLITLNRPMSTEAAAGKNPVSHVGKIYNVFSHYLASRIHDTSADIDEARVWICSQIGRPISDPWSVSVELTTRHAAESARLNAVVNELVRNEFAAIGSFTDALCRGEYPVC